MIQVIFAIITAFGPRTDELARGAQRTAPTYLTAYTAPEHAFAAVIAGKIYDVEPALLLSIAWHESRYEIAAVTPEIGHKVSCGAMTPEPIARCPAPSLLGGYLAGARHLRGWLDAEHGNLRLALLGYAGGGYLIRFCRDGGEAKGCRTPEVFLARAAWIVRAGVGPSV
jgi:soluble lytic murein transglycosylase-like protein